jgi:hypothetical protein
MVMLTAALTHSLTGSINHRKFIWTSTSKAKMKVLGKYRFPTTHFKIWPSDFIPSVLLLTVRNSVNLKSFPSKPFFKLFRKFIFGHVKPVDISGKCAKSNMII